MTGFQNGHSGGCQCGAIRYRTVRHSGNAYVCNCRFCQRMTGGPYLVEHCFTKDEVDLLSGTPKTYTHVSDGSGKKVYVHFCGDCGSHLFLTLERWEETQNIFTTTLDDPKDVDYGPDTLRYLFLDSAQSGTVTPAGFHAFAGHCDPADGSVAGGVVCAAHLLDASLDPGDGPHKGGCLCGAVRFEAEGDPDWVVICHCRSCQKSLGSGVNFELLFSPARFRVTRGVPSVHRHPGGSGKMLERRFCGTCGTPMWLTGERFPEVGVFRGALDRPNRIAVSPDNAIQIYLDEALPSGMVLAGIEAYAQHRRAPDDTINEGRVYSAHWRIGDGAPV